MKSEIQNPKSKNSTSELRTSEPGPDASAVSYGPSLLLEIGTEEIPARFLPPAIELLKQNSGNLFREYQIEYSDIRTYATPRRLILMVKRIHPLQKDVIKEVFGPSKKAAFDENNIPTKAAIGFANSQGIEVSRLVVRTKDKGEYVAAVRHQKGAAVKELLPVILEKLILSLHFQKAMRWGISRLRFVRPIHWILALYGEDTILFDIDGVRSGNTTKGHRFLSPGTLPIREISSYINRLANNFVIVSQDERKKIISEGIERLASSAKGNAVKDEELLNTVANLVEFPVPVLCGFPADYLSLPKELLTVVMKGHQKYFAIEDKEGNLRNHFLAVSNTRSENSGTVKAGAERVIKARFEDARFYYEEDLCRSLHSRIEDLKKVTFHDRLGTLFCKTEKVVRMSGFFSDALFPDKRQHIERAAWLCKADLITGVVGEFPELQGLMGRHYALHHGESPQVAEAVGAHYLPCYSGDRIPDSDEGAVISLSDKIDNIVSFFGIGIMPTGSEDPFALRRQALAIISILIEKNYDISLNKIIGKAVKNLAAKASSPSLSKEVLDFIIQRLEHLLASQGYDSDTIQSVLYFAGDVPLGSLTERIRAVKEFRAHSGYGEFLLAIKRINNIIPETGLPALKKKLLTEQQEKSLCKDVLNIKPSVRKLLEDREYYKALSLLATLTGPVSIFFEKVLVMDKRGDIRLNRLALLKEIWDMAFHIADFSMLT